MNYPLAPIEEWWGDCQYKELGGHVVLMTPEEFLSLCPPLSLDSFTREAIQDLVDHIQMGNVLDPAVISEHRHDGRHRAYACIQLQIGKIPVIDYRLKDQYDGQESEVGVPAGQSDLS